MGNLTIKGIESKGITETFKVRLRNKPKGMNFLILLDNKIKVMKIIYYWKEDKIDIWVGLGNHGWYAQSNKLHFLLALIIT